MVLAVIALCATGVFGASLNHLTATSGLWGDPEQVSFDPANTALVKSLNDNPEVTAITKGVGGGEVMVNGKIVGSIVGTAVKGTLLFSTVVGHPPVGDGQIGLGVSTMHLVGAHIGSVVDVTVTTHSGAQRTEPFRVVSQPSFPQLGGFVSLGTGVLMTTADLVHIACPPGTQQALCRQKTGGLQTGGIRVSFVSGPRGKAAMERYVAANAPIVTTPIAPTSLVNFGEAVNFPLIFGVMLAVFGAATLAHLLVVSVSRRRRDVGLLKVLGFVNRQVVSTVSWQATTLALVGVAPRCPPGAGRRPCRVEHLRLQPGGGPRHRAADPARRCDHRGGARGRQRHRHRAGMGCDAIEGGGPPATPRLNACGNRRGGRGDCTELPRLKSGVARLIPNEEISQDRTALRAVLLRQRARKQRHVHAGVRTGRQLRVDGCSGRHELSS